jgi:hypothetical protein
MVTPGVENRDYGRKGSAALTTRHPSIPNQKLALTSPTSAGRLVGIVRSWTKATELLLFITNGYAVYHISICISI